MVAVGEEPEKLDAILITHEHLDHVAGLSVMARKLKVPVFFTEATHRALGADGDSANDDELCEVAGFDGGGEGGARGGVAGDAAGACGGAGGGGGGFRGDAGEADPLRG